MEWQPIETAPKDGKEILVSYGRQGNVMELVWYDLIFKYWKSKGESRLGLETNATHWKRIDPPK